MSIGIIVRMADGRHAVGRVGPPSPRTDEPVLVRDGALSIYTNVAAIERFMDGAPDAALEPYRAVLREAVVIEAHI